MISLKDINNAITTQVTNGLINTAYKSVEFASTDIKEEIKRPSLFFEIVDNKTGLFNANNKERTTNIKIYYFPSNKYKYKIELMEVQQYMENIFLKYVKTDEDFYINIEEINFDIVNGVLICNLELYTLEDITDEIFADTVHSKANENQEIMENIEIK